MSHHNTVFTQLLKLISRHEFESLEKQHHQGQRLRKISRWSQFIALMPFLGSKVAKRSRAALSSKLSAPILTFT